MKIKKEKETKFDCPVAGCSFVGTAFEINMHFQDMPDDEHLKKEHQLETAMNDAYDAAEWNWVVENCKEAEEEEK